MNKREFLSAVKIGLSYLPAEEAEERVNFLSEMIEDVMEEGLTEEEAILRIGTPEEIIKGILSEIEEEDRSDVESERGAMPSNNKDFESGAVAPTERGIGRKRMSGGAITLIAVGSVVWVPLLIAAFAVGFSLYAAMWSVIASLWAAFAAFAVSCPAGIAAGACMAFGGGFASGAFTVGAALICGGLAIFSFFGCLKLTALTCTFTKRIFIWLGTCFKRGDR